MLNSKPSIKQSCNDNGRDSEFSQALVTREQIPGSYELQHLLKTNNHLIVATYIVLGNIPELWFFASGRNGCVFLCPPLWGEHELNKNFLIKMVMVQSHHHQKWVCSHFLLLAFLHTKPKIKHLVN